VVILAQPDAHRTSLPSSDLTAPNRQHPADVLPLAEPILVARLFSRHLILLEGLFPGAVVMPKILAVRLAISVQQRFRHPAEAWSSRESASLLLSQSE